MKGFNSIKQKKNFNLYAKNETFSFVFEFSLVLFFYIEYFFLSKLQIVLEKLSLKISDSDNTKFYHYT